MNESLEIAGGAEPSPTRDISQGWCEENKDILGHGYTSMMAVGAELVEGL